MLNHVVPHHVHDHFSHAAGLAVSRALEDDVLHLPAAQMLHALFAQHPGYGVRDIALAAAVWPDNGGNAIPCKDNFGVVREGFEPGDLEAFQFEHARKRLLSPKPELKAESERPRTGVPI